MLAAAIVHTDSMALENDGFEVAQHLVKDWTLGMMDMNIDIVGKSGRGKDKLNKNKIKNKKSKKLPSAFARKVYFSRCAKNRVVSTKIHQNTPYLYRYET